MTTYQDLVDTMRLIQERTGDPLAWMGGLTPEERIAAVSPVTSGTQLADILAKIRRQHPDLFAPAAAVPPDRADGDAAKAIADAETALAHQNSATSQLDLQVVSAILNAHLTTVEGRDALTELQHEIETAVVTRSDLDTPAGARDFQRFLIGKLRDIRQVVATASLDDTSKSALMAAWTSLYNASKNTPETSAGPRAATAPTPPDVHGGDQQPAPHTASNPLLDSLLLDDPDAVPTGAPGPVPVAASPVPSAPGGGAAPSGAPAGASVPPSGASGGFALPNLPSPSTAGTGRSPRAFNDDLFGDDADDREAADKHDHDQRDDEQQQQERRDPAAAPPESPSAGATTVTLPTGETVTAASPQLAAAIRAAAGGTPIAEAFQQQGITIAPPGTAVATPLDPSRLEPGDIGMFTDRHALALGRNKALLDGQIQHISTVTGPSFLGWEHPPAPSTQARAPATQTPTPTRPSAMA